MSVDCTLPLKATSAEEQKAAARAARGFLHATGSIEGAYQKMTEALPGMHPESIRRAIDSGMKEYKAEARKAGMEIQIESSEAQSQFKRLERYKSYKQGAINRLQEKINARDLSPAKRSHTILDIEAAKLQNQYAGLMQEWQGMRKEFELSQRPALQKAIDYFVELARQVKLTGLVTAAKVAAYTPYKLAEVGAGDVAAGMGSLIPGMREVMLRAPTEGVPSLEGYGQLGKGMVAGAKEIPNVLKGKVAPDEIVGAEGKTRISKGLVELPARSHAAIKQPLKSGLTAMYLEKATQAAIRRGEDLSLPGAFEAEQKRAVAAGKAGILLRDNLITKTYTRALQALEKEGGTPGYVASKTAQLLLPIVRIATNIPIETARFGHGIPTSIVRRIAVELKGGLEKATPEQLDLIAKNFKSGTIGIGLGLAAYLLRDKISSLYVPGKNPEEESFMGLKGVPAKIINHNPAILWMKTIATMGHLIDSGTSTPEAGFKAMYAMLRNVPFLDLAHRIEDLVAAKNLKQSATKFTGQVVGGLVPAISREAAEVTDKGKKRSPKTVLDYAKQSVPGLRQQVPEKQEKIINR